MRIEPDKVRFCDPEATSNAYLIHTVELSDERSVKQFMTFWCEGGRDQTPRSAEWAARHKLGPQHDREIYHREPDPWLPEQFPGMEARGWTKHYHADLTALPTWGDFEPYLDEVPPVIEAAVKEYLCGREP